MIYTAREVYDFVRQEDVKFIRLAFCDVNGKQKNISIMPDELPRAFSDGISFDASAIKGFGDEVGSDLLLFPVPSTLNILPWRSSHGNVIRMFCSMKYPDGTQFEKDSRMILQRAVDAAAAKGVSVQFGAEFEFYLFNTDEKGMPTDEPFDRAGYMDVAPEDRGENARREICLTLLEMGIKPESSHHEEGPGQNEIDFRYSDAMTAADNAMNFMTVVKATAQRNGIYADFSPKPLPGESGNGLHINMSVKTADGEDHTNAFMAGILAHIKEMTAFLNPTEDSYKRLGEKKAPKYITWSPENRSQLIRIPAAKGEYRRIELRSPDPTANPYIAYALLIMAGLDGIERELNAPEAVNINLYKADSSVTEPLDRLPASLDEAIAVAEGSDFIRGVIGMNITDFLGI
ncbi:MAG: glutamine synthetase family protein [Oscillospiraceae bacterium]|nr:glutamine synthetase family protein [Oscillospiraceae bacterium]